PRRRHLERGDEERADEAADAEDAEVERDADGPHGAGDLGVEELLHAHHGEHVGDAEEDVLREEPEYAQAAAGRGRRGGAGAARLDERGYRHGDDGEHHPDADPLEHGDPLAVAGERHHHPVVERHEEDDGDGDGALQHRWRDHEHGADAVVHQHPLLGEERHRLLEDDREHEQHRPDWQQPHYDLAHAWCCSLTHGLLLLLINQLQ
ncbi:Os06g0239400, partial [Oryza sativa Japonica Group]